MGESAVLFSPNRRKGEHRIQGPRVGPGKFRGSNHSRSKGLPPGAAGEVSLSIGRWIGQPYVVTLQGIGDSQNEAGDNPPQWTYGFR